MKIDEKVIKEYKVEIHHEEMTGKTFLEGNETNDSSGTISEPSVGSDENKRKTNKFNWLFWKKS